MDNNILIDIYLANVILRIKQLNRKNLSELEIEEVVNAEYHKLRKDFDREVLPKLTEDEIEHFFETLYAKSSKLIDIIINKKKD